MLLSRHALQILTKAITCALLNALGDIFCQFFIEGSPWDIKRTLTFTGMVRTPRS